MKQLMEICYEHHPYYSKLMRANGITPGDIQSVDDLVKFPVTTKEQFVADPDAFRLRDFGKDAEDRALYRTVYTTGSTTGVPAPVYVTAADHYDYMVRSSRRRDFIDIRSGDVIVSLFPLTPYPMGAYGRALSEASACGAALLEVNPGRAVGGVSPHRTTSEVSELLAHHDFDVLWGIPSYVLSFLEASAQDGRDMPRLRMCMTTGEGLSGKMKARIEAAMEAVGAARSLVLNRYGSTEQGSAMVECSPGSGFHDLAPDSVLMETLDVETGRTCNDGEEGDLAFTHLNRTGTVLIRFAVGDRAILSHSPCPACSRSGSVRMVSGPSRSGNIIKVKGTLVNMSAVCSAIEATSGVENFQLALSSDAGRDAMTARIVRCEESSPKQVEDSVVEAVQKAANVTPRIEFVQHEVFDRESGASKFKKFVDLRKDR